MCSDIVTLHRGRAITDEAERKARVCLDELSGQLRRLFRKHGTESTLIALRSAYSSACIEMMRPEQAKQHLQQMIDNIDVAQVLLDGGGRS